MHMNRFAVLAGLVAFLVLAVAGPVAASHAVRNAGDGTLMGTFWIDFDNGVLNTSVTSQKDMQFHVVSAQNRYLMPNTGELILKVGSSEPSYSTCASAALVNKDYNVKHAVGNWFCFKTAPGRYARFHIDSKDPFPGGVQITWTTWEL